MFLMDEIVTKNVDKIRGYKAVCAKLGFVMCSYFICRILAGVIILALSQIKVLTGNTAVLYSIQSLILILMVYGVPTLFAMFLFKSFDLYSKSGGRLRKLYEKPKRLAKALGNFPAMYGLGFGVNLLTILVFYLIRRISQQLDASVELQRFFEPITFEPPKDLVSAFIMVFLFVVVAAVVEEFFVRGIMYDALKPYGAGTAIIISSILFGLMHGSIHMLFYTTILGFALGYIRYATDSLLVVTVLHAMINSVAAGLLFILSLSEIADGNNALINSLSEVYIIFMFALIVLGIVAIIKKIPVIKRYKITNDWDEVSPKKKMAMFFISVPVILMLIFAIDEHAGNMLLNIIMGGFINA